jgi:hypothetical protein
MEVFFFGTVWAAGFESQACKFYFLCISAESAKEKERRKKVLLPADVLKSAAHTVFC